MRKKHNYCNWLQRRFFKKHLQSFESEIIFVNNQNYETSNNMYSAYLGIKNIDPA